MALNKVEICGVDTAKLPLLKEEEKRILFERIKNETHRPLLKQGFGVEKIDEILQKRESNYQKAVIVVDTTEKSSYNIISEILKRIEEYAE